MTVCKVFVSSTTLDLYKYREVARDVIRRVNETFGGRFSIVPVAMDTQTQDGETRRGERKPPLDSSRQWVRDSDWVVLIVAWNYGYVPPGETSSVTEWEYTEAVNSGKKCFVFLAGDLKDPEDHQYFPIDREGEGVVLSNFRGNPDYRSQEQDLAKFHALLRATSRFSLFRNIVEFRGILTDTLTNKIIAELFRTLGPQIVALGLQPPLQACIAGVKVLAQLKKLHDRLHRVRQFGIRRWRESLLTRWPDDAPPQIEARIEYLEGLPEIERLLGQIETLASELPDNFREALPHLVQVIEHKFPKVPDCGKSKFEDSTEVFASRVQKAFTSCNSQMQQSGRELDQMYRNLTDSTREALNRNKVDPAREQLLQSELDRADSTYQRLQRVLQNHYDWQFVHDELERIDCCIDNLSSDDDEVRESRAQTFRLAVADLTESRGSVVGTLLKSATEIFTLDNTERLTVWPEIILRVRNHLDAFIAKPDVNHYQAMRTTYDDLFFQIDRETLHTMKTAEGQARAIDAGLQNNDDGIKPPVNLVANIGNTR